MLSILKLQGVIIYHIAEQYDKFNVKIGQPKAISRCLHCDSDKIIRYGKGRKRIINHGRNVDGKDILLHWQSFRHKCNNCGRTFSTSPPETLVSGKEKYSKHCKWQALRILCMGSFSNATKNTGISYHKLRLIMTELLGNKALLKIPDDVELSIGIDEHSRAGKKLATTVTLLNPEKRLLGIIPHATAKQLHKWCSANLTNEQRERVTEISVDMTKSLKTELKKIFPNSKFVIDRFHVIAYLNDLMIKEYRFLVNNRLSAEARRQLPSRIRGKGAPRLLGKSGIKLKKFEMVKIGKIFELMPEIANLWYAKNELESIYRECDDKCEAKRRIDNIKHFLPKTAKNTLSKFTKEIVNYFDKRTTNGFTEGVHTKIKLIKRYSYGLRNPETYVKKIELGFVDINKLIATHTS